MLKHWLHQSQQVYSSIVTDAIKVCASLNQAATWEWDVATQRFWFSHELRALLGMEAGSERFEFAPQQWGSISQEPLVTEVQLTRSLPTVDLCYPVHIPDGIQIVLHETGTLWLDEQGAPRLLRGQVVRQDHDISQPALPVFPKFLSIGHDALEALLNASGTVMMVLDLSGHIVFFSKTAEDLTGYRFAEVARRPVWTLFLPECDRTAAHQAFTELVQRGESTQYENTWILRDGRQRQMIWYSVAIQQSAETPACVLTQGFDATERKASESLILQDREQQATLRELLELVLRGEELESTLAAALKKLLSVSWLALLPKGGIFLRDTKNQEMRLRISHLLSPQIMRMCDRLIPGVCHCGRALQSAQVQFAACLDAHHEVTYVGITDHGHYSVPLLSGDRVLGILVLYLSPGFIRDPLKEQFIVSACDILAGYILHKYDEQALRESEYHLKWAQAIAHVGSWIAEISSRQFLPSQEAGRILGCPHSCLKWEQWFALIHVEDRQHFLEQWAASIHHGTEFQSEFRLQNAQETVWIHAIAEVELDERQCSLRLIGMLRDISEARNAQLGLLQYQESLERLVEERSHLLKMEEQRSRLILESSADGLFGLDEQGYITFANPATCRILGYSHEELLTQHILNLIQPTHATEGDEPAAEFPVWTAIYGDQLIKIDSEYFWRSDGQPIMVEYEATPIHQDDQVTGTVVSFRDITERQAIQDTLRESEANLAHAQAIARIGSWHLDPRRDQLTGSEEIYRIFDMDTALPMSWQALLDKVDPLDRERVMGTWQSALTGRAYDHAYRIRVQNRVKWVRERAEVQMDSHQQPRAVVGAIQDITEIKGAEIATQQALLEAQRLAKAKSEFLANMSHEIRTPLNAVLGLARLGARDCQERMAKDHFLRIQDSGNHLLGLVNDILDFSKIEAGKLVLENIPFRLGDAIDRAIGLTAELAFARGLDLQVCEDPDLPRQLHGDIMRLTQILVNLLTNAIKFTEIGMVRLTVSQSDQSLVFRVQDSGIGMSIEQVERLFLPFEQADTSTTRKFGGTGLGLTITERLVKAMAGAVQVQSQIGRGSEFTVTLPLRVVQPVESSPMPPFKTLRVAGFSSAESEIIAEVLRDLGVQVEASPLNEAFQHPVPERLLLDGTKALQHPAVLGAIRQHQLGNTPIWVLMTPDIAHRLVNEGLSGVRLLHRPLRLRHMLEESTALETTIAIPGNRLQGLRILAAEDVPVNCVVLADILEQEGAEVVFAENGQQALDQVRAMDNYPFHLVLMDIQMPVMDGYQATRAILQDCPRLPIIGLTAHAIPEERDRCLAAGMLDRVTKPIHTDELVRAILHGIQESQKPEVMAPAIQHRDELFTPEGESTLAASETNCPSSLIDWTAINKRFNHREDFIDKLLTSVLTHQQVAAEALCEAVAHRDFQRIAFIAHGLKGVAGNIEAVEVREWAKAVEDCARSQNAEVLEQATALSEQLKQLLNEISVFLARERKPSA